MFERSRIEHNFVLQFYFFVLSNVEAQRMSVLEYPYHHRKPMVAS